MKAAANAISLATRWPAPAGVARALTAVAEEELARFRDVLALLERGGIGCGRPETDAYAADLRRAVRLDFQRHSHEHGGELLLLAQARSQLVTSGDCRGSPC